MKHNKIYHFFGWLSASALLLTTACADHAELYLSQANKEGMRTVTFHVQPESQTMETRAEGEFPHISDGTKADVLVYAVYKKEGDRYVLDTSFNEEDEVSLNNAGLTEGMNTRDFSVEKRPVTIQLNINPEEDYKFVFWAQDKTCTAYDISNLAKVKVDYKNALNNDESRDAFCASVTLAGTAEQIVKLRRPLAQVNVGTAGWDYEGAAILKPSPVGYTHSKITLSGVAQYYDAVSGKTLGKDGLEDNEEATTEVTFDYDWIPALYNATEDEKKDYTFEPLDDKEEYLKVNLYKDEECKYVSWKEYDTWRKSSKGDSETNTEEPEADIEEPEADTEEPKTEWFKYLSMCYVLVPESTDADNQGSVLQSVKFRARGFQLPESKGNEEKNDDEALAVDEAEQISDEFTITNVPVRKNWRTNILSKNFFTTTEQFIIDIEPEYMGDYNDNGTTTGDWPGMNPGLVEKGGTYSVSFENGASGTQDGTFFTIKISGTLQDLSPSSKYNDKIYSKGTKMDSSAEIAFSTQSLSTVTIVQATKVKNNESRGWAGISLDESGYSYKSPEANNIYADNTKNDNNQYVRIYTIKNVPAGLHSIKQNSAFSTDEHFKEGDSAPTQAAIIYVEVTTEDLYEVKEPEDLDKDKNGKFPGYQGDTKNGQGE